MESALERLPREIVEKEIFSFVNLDFPSAVSLSLVSSYYNRLLRPIIRRFVIDAFQRDNEAPIKELLVSCSRLEYWNLFRFFSSLSLPAIRSLRVISFQELVISIISMGKLDEYFVFERESG